MQHNFKRLGVAMVTPFKADQSVDYDGLTHLTNHLIDGNTSFLVVQGTTGETATLCHAERNKVLSHIVEVNNGRLPIVLGVGGNNTQAVVNELQTRDLTGVDGILSVSPYYNKPTQEGIFQHFKAVGAATNLPIILYNVPGRTSANVSWETTVRCAKEIQNIVAVKEASGNMDQVMKIIQHKPDGFTVLSGDDALTLPMLACGAEGLISVIGNAYPKEYSQMINHAVNNDTKSAQKNHFSLLRMVDLLFAEGNPAGIKEALQYLKICENHLRLPLVNVGAELSAEIEKEMKGL